MIVEEDFVMDAIYCIPIPPSLMKITRMLKDKGDWSQWPKEEQEKHWQGLVDEGYYWDYYIGGIKRATRSYGKNFRNTPKRALPNGLIDQPSMCKYPQREDEKYRKMWLNETGREDMPLLKVKWDGELI